MSDYTMNIDSTSYTNKDFRTIFPELLDLVRGLTDSWDPVNSNESDPGVALLKLQAFIADKLNYNIDKNILENFPSSVTQRGNAQKIYELVGYNMKWYRSATTAVTFKYAKGENTSDLELESFTIPKYTQLKDSSGEIVYTLLNNAVVYRDNRSVEDESLTAIEGTYHEYSLNGTNLITINNLDADYRLYFNESQVASNGVFINNYGIDELWEVVDNLDATQLGRKVFKFGVLPNSNTCYIQFPQDAAEIFGQGINIGYIISSGAAGNIKAKKLSNLFSELSVPIDDEGSTIEVSTYVRVNNPASATNGQDPESLSQAYKNYQKTVGTFNTLVTLQDYQNAIYNTGKVSNCVVSDRTSDLHNSYKIQTKTLGGNQLKTVTTKKSILLENNVTYDQPTMNAFNLAVYTLNKVPSVYDGTSYNKTFNTSYDAQSDAQESIEDYKSVQHDWVDVINDGATFPYLIKNLISLYGKVFTHQKVSAAEAEAIEKNINLALYKTYQSRNINFGEELDYEGLIETIQGADTRIKSVILDDPEINTKLMDSDNYMYDIDYSLLEDDPEMTTAIKKFKVNLLAKAILAGITPWCTFNNNAQLSYMLQPTYKLNTSDVVDDDGIINIDNIDIPSIIDKDTVLKDIDSQVDNVAAITTQVNIPLTTSGYTLRSNETVFFYRPSFITKTQLSTYLYVYLKSKSDDSIDKVVENSIYQLRGNDKLFVAETADDLLYMVKNGDEPTASEGVCRIYESGTIINPNYELAANVTLKSSDDGYSKTEIAADFNLESSKNINIMEINASYINIANPDEEDQSLWQKKDMYAVWIVNNVTNQLFTDWIEQTTTGGGTIWYSEHILQNDEIFIYTDANKSDLVILQSGTKLRVESSYENIRDAASSWTCASLSLEEVQNNGINADFDWQSISRFCIFKVQEMQIETIGAGCTLSVTNNNIKDTSGAEINELTNKEVLIDPSSCSAIHWSIDGETYSLPVVSLQNSAEGNWTGMSRLSIVATPLHPFTLAEYIAGDSKKGSYQTLALYKFENQTIPDGNGYIVTHTLAAIIGPGQSIATNYLTMLTGGIKQNTTVLQEDNTYSADLSVSIYKFNDIVNNNKADTLFSINSQTSGVTISQKIDDDKFTSDFVFASDNTSVEANMSLSTLFNGSIIPIAISSLIDCKVTIKNVQLIQDCKFVNDNDTIKTIPEYNGTTGVTLTNDNNVYYLYLKSDDDDIPELSIEIDITRPDSATDNEKFTCSVVLFTPVKIKALNSILAAQKYTTTGANQSEIKTNVFDEMIDLASTAVTSLNSSSSDSINQFNYTYQIDEDDVIEDPLLAESFYLDNHIYNKYTISQLDINNINIKVAKQSKQ